MDKKIITLLSIMISIVIVLLLFNVFYVLAKILFFIIGIYVVTIYSKKLCKYIKEIIKRD